MKPSLLFRLRLPAVAIAAAIIGGATVQAGTPDYASGRNNYPGSNARLTVYRSADFGTDIFLNLYVDGVQVTTLPINTGYEAFLRPGDHVLGVCTTPCPYGKTKFTYRRIRMERGQTYNFAALWDFGDYARLETPSAAALAKLSGRY